MNNITKSAQIKFEKIEDIKKFISIVNQYNFDITLSLDEYTVNAKSIIEVFSLDINEKLTVTAYTNEDTDFFNNIKEYIIK